MTSRARLWGLAGLLVVLWTALCAPASAQTVIEKLVSPGKLSAAHAKLEVKCQSCHAAFDKRGQSALCMDCHKPIAADVAGKSGFHGRNRDVQGVECKSCHKDHVGRDFRMVRFDPNGFNHVLTDYPLHGAHTKVACAKCHVAGVKYRAAPTACVGCHKQKDPHKGALGPACADCHTDNAWKEVRFDHAKTDFPLLGVHARTACKACHADPTYKGAPSACVSCHAKDDAHKGSLGPQCGSCHTASGWTPARFDHARTGFPLAGAHARAECADCHPNNRYQDAKPTCISCHKKDDVHSGRLGLGCADCHNARDWKVTKFDHGRTGFGLNGAHAAVECKGCHLPSPAKSKQPGKTCISCHQKDDTHKGLNGPNCEQCHTESDWKKATFDHNVQTKFPLKGAHAKITCATCHVQPAQTVKLALTCISCHKKDDQHAGQLGAECATCHSDVSWKTNVRFDHGLVAFPLIGKHETVACEGCHKSKRYKDAPITCAACHVKDDRHKGAYKMDCGGCHNAASWSAWAFDHNRTQFLLDGRHVDAPCASCHRPGHGKADRTCVSCHQAEDVHNGAFGPACEQCHTTSTFTGARTTL